MDNYSIQKHKNTKTQKQRGDSLFFCRLFWRRTQKKLKRGCRFKVVVVKFLYPIPHGYYLK